MKHIREKLLFTLFALLIFRLGSFIPIPGVNKEVLQFQDQASVFGFLNTFGGGALQNFSVFAMGIMPYITASIIVQLLQMDVLPKFSEWAKQGEDGRKKLTQVTRYGTVPLAFVQALGMGVGFNTMFPGLYTDTGVVHYLFVSMILTAGTMFLLWLGEQITAKGLGNGISILIVAGIISSIPSALNELYAQQLTVSGDQLFIKIVTLVLIALAILALIVGVVYMHQAVRKIPIQYSKQGGGELPQNNASFLPIKVNAAGVIPVIFAMALLVFPSTIANFAPPTNQAVVNILSFFDYTTPTGMLVYAVLIIAFSYFYTFIQVDPEKLSKNLQQQGAYIPGIRPGKSTQDYITNVLYRLTFIGSLFLASLSLLPMIFTTAANLPPSVQIGGTSLLIVVSVSLETTKQISAQMITKHYKGFLKKD